MSIGPNIISASGEDIDVLARTVYGEAGGETLSGQAAVAWVIRHRAEAARAFRQRHGKTHILFGNGDIAGACRMPKQFSCWNHGDPNRARIMMVNLDNPDFQRAHHIATGVVLGLIDDAMPGTTHYYAPALVAAPAWACKPDGALLPYKTIGGHRFLEEVR
jgi:spore germination cell wall hydrolase CwlJ-like protein